MWESSRLSDVDVTTFERDVYENQAAVHDWLKKAEYYGSPQILRTAERLLSHEDCLWLFLTRPGVEPTDNHAERMLRQAVLWRKKRFGTASGDPPPIWWTLFIREGVYWWHHDKARQT